MTFSFHGFIEIKKLRLLKVGLCKFFCDFGHNQNNVFLTVSNSTTFHLLNVFTSSTKVNSRNSVSGAPSAFDKSSLGKISTYIGSDFTAIQIICSICHQTIPRSWPSDPPASPKFLLNLTKTELIISLAQLSIQHVSKAVAHHPSR